MKISVKILPILVLFLSQNLVAQDNIQTNRDILHYYDTEFFQWNYDFWGGLTLNFQNQNSSTMFGLRDSMVRALSLYDDSYRQYRSYRSKNITGNVFFWTGFAAILASPFIFVYGPWDGDTIRTSTVNTGLGVMSGGLISLLIGSFVLNSGQVNLFDAVNIYNRNRIIDFRNP